MKYFDFEAWIRVATTPHVYPVFVTSSPAGPASNFMTLDLDDAALDTLLTTVKSGIESLEVRQTFGQLLYNHLFAGPVRDCWVDSRGRISAKPNQGLRVRLWIDAPELGALPWELLHDGTDFLAAAANVVLSRYLAVAEPPAFVTPKQARVLIVVQEPPDMEVLPAVPQALESFLTERSQRFAPPKTLRNTSLADINTELLKGYQVLHYIGHGAPEKLLLASDNETAIKDGQEFAALFSGQPDLQLVVLNVCSSGATTTRGIFSGLGPFLAQKRLPAVVAMQYASVLQTSAAEFNATFYEALDQSCAVDVAVNTARRSLLLKHPTTRDWSTPVLYMTTRTGQVMQFVQDEAEALVLAAERASEQIQREAIQREVTVALGELSIGLRRIEDIGELLDVARSIEARLNADGSAVTRSWKLLRQNELRRMESFFKGRAEFNAFKWWPKMFSAAESITINLENSNHGIVKDKLGEFESALGDAILELNQAIQDQLRFCQSLSESTVAKLRLG